MTTEKELNAAILKKTLMIQERFPELSKYIEEMPITIPVNNPEINLKQLTDYYNSLENLIEKYAKNHWYTEGSFDFGFRIWDVGELPKSDIINPTFVIQYEYWRVS